MKRLTVCTLAVFALAAAPAAFGQDKPDTGKAAASSATHKTVATVKKVDQKAGKVTLAHEPVKSLNWPSMTMGFKVADPKLFDKLAEGKRVEVEFEQSGKDYVVTSVK